MLLKSNDTPVSEMRRGEFAGRAVRTDFSAPAMRPLALAKIGSAYTCRHRPFSLTGIDTRPQFSPRGVPADLKQGCSLACLSRYLPIRAYRDLLFQLLRGSWRFVSPRKCGRFPSILADFPPLRLWRKGRIPNCQLTTKCQRRDC